MIERFGNIWDYIDEFDGVVITTNGFYKSNGEAVMGRGIALEARNRYPWLAGNLGTALRTKGNHVFRFDIEPNFNRDSPYNFSLYTFPVKPQYGPNGEMGWQAKAEIELIERSAWEMRTEIDGKPDYRVIMCRPGCGNGGLRWEDVKPVLDPILDDRFTVMERA
jgi:hypothetical protein